MALDRRSFERDKRVALIVVIASSGLVLLIACANIANLALTRVLARRRELTVRAALGATRQRLMAHVMLEGGIVALGGGVAAMALAGGTIGALPALLPAELRLFDANPAVLDTRALTVCAVGAVVAGMLCGWIPAARALRLAASHAGADSPKIVGSDVVTRRLQVMLQSMQVALTLVLLTGAGLLAASFTRMVRTEAGYDIDRLLVAELDAPPGRQRGGSLDQAFERWLTEFAGVPGVRVAVGQPPGTGSSGRIVAAGRENDPPRGGIVSVVYASPEYFAVAGISHRTGRLFDTRDSRTSPPVALIDEQTAAVHWPGESALGKTFRWFPNMPLTTVIGIVRPVKTKWFASEDGSGQVYLPVAQLRYGGFRSVVVRAEGDLAGAAQAMQATLQSIDPSLRFDRITPATSLYDDVLSEPRVLAFLSMGFAVTALLTALIGLYGIVNHAVLQRTREIGVRMALGAGPDRVRALVWRQAMTPMAIGLPIGLLAAWWLSRYLASQLYSTSVHDPVAFTGVVVVLLATATLAAYVPARRATRINPVETLRVE